MEVLFQIGKELAELRCRLEAMERRMGDLPRGPALRPSTVVQPSVRGTPEKRLECAFANRFWTRRILARSSRPSRFKRPARLPLDLGARLVCTLFTCPSLIGPA